MSTLVSYASRHGATREIAERIAWRIALRTADFGETVDLRHLDEVGPIGRYDRVVFGAPVYDQNWPPEADRFVTANRDALALIPLWLFSVGSFGDTRRLVGRVAQREPRNIAELRDALHPREYRVFQGVVLKHQWPFWSRVLYHALGGRFGDHRDWRVIDEWADSIAASVPVPREPNRT